MMGISNSPTKTRRGRYQLVSEINVTPLIDVMLVLLVIFMITAPMMISGINVDLQDTRSAPLKGHDEPLAISIDKAGSIYIMDTKIEPQHLVEKLKAITHAKMDTRIFVRGDKNLTYGSIMSVVGEINAAGFSRVALITNVKQHDK